jgi:CheY-like chemotaxis protein
LIRVTEHFFSRDLLAHLLNVRRPNLFRIEELRNRPILSVVMSKILLVEDDIATRLTISTILRNAGHAVMTANDGQECLNLYRIAAADVVIMDIFMPNKDGLETLLELRREFPHASVIAISGHREMNLMLKAAKGMGAVRALTKPFEPETLVAIVAEEMDWIRGLAKAHKPQAGDVAAA